jgi:hypothetical protein
MTAEGEAETGRAASSASSAAAGYASD